MENNSINDIFIKAEADRIKKDIYSVQSNLFEAIFSRLELKKHLNELDCNVVHISLYDPDQQPEITNKFIDSLYIPVWDLEEDMCQYKTITESQAKEIRDFILKHKEKKFLINCEAGISRSAGVGLAVECLVKHNGDKYEFATSFSEVKNHVRYSPNLTFFDKIVSGD